MSIAYQQNQNFSNHAWSRNMIWFLINSLFFVVSKDHQDTLDRRVCLNVSDKIIPTIIWIVLKRTSKRRGQKIVSYPPRCVIKWSTCDCSWITLKWESWAFENSITDTVIFPPITSTTKSRHRGNLILQWWLKRSSTNVCLSWSWDHYHILRPRTNSSLVIQIEIDLQSPLCKREVHFLLRSTNTLNCMILLIYLSLCGRPKSIS